MRAFCSARFVASCGLQRYASPRRSRVRSAPSLSMLLAGRARDHLLAHDDARGRSPARPGHTLRRRHGGLDQHDPPPIFPGCAVDTDHRRVCPVLRRLVFHRLHGSARRPDPQLHRTRGAPTISPALSPRDRLRSRMGCGAILCAVSSSSRSTSSSSRPSRRNG